MQAHFCLFGVGKKTHCSSTKSDLIFITLIRYTTCFLSCETIEDLDF